MIIVEEHFIIEGISVSRYQNFGAVVHKVAYLLVFGIICLAMPLQSVLVRFDYLTLPNGKKLFVLFELHILMTERDKEQLTSLEQFLSSRSVRDSERMHLMVEVPSLLVQQYTQAQKVTYDIVRLAEYSPSVVAEDIEIRCKSMASGYILSFSAQDFEDENLAQEQYNAGSIWCTVGDITVRDLLEEFSVQKARLCVDDKPSVLRAICRKKYEEIDEAERQLKSFLEELHARLDERILDLSKRLLATTEFWIRRVNLRSRISNVGSPLFELHILKKILETPQTYCMIVAGNKHGEWICEAMEHLGATYQLSETDGVRPLRTGALDKLQSGIIL